MAESRGSDRQAETLQDELESLQVRVCFVCIGGKYATADQRVAPQDQVNSMGTTKIEQQAKEVSDPTCSEHQSCQSAC
jgi:hypothetical protein